MESVQTEKLQKLLSRLGIASRREAEDWIASGRVLVNDRIAALGDRVGPGDDVSVDGRRIAVATGEQMERLVIAYHKAEGEVVSRNDPEGRPTVFDRLPPLRGQRWVSVGRLDLNTSGLLLFTNDGEFANRLMHPSTGVEREYAVRVRDVLAPEQKRALLEGVMLEDGLSRFLAITDAGSQGSSHWYRCSLVGSKYREVTRLWESQGQVVERLVQIRFGTFTMPSTLRQGTCIRLGDGDVAGLEQLCTLQPKKHTGLYGRARRMATRQERGDMPRERENTASPREQDEFERAGDVDGNRIDRPRGRGGYLRGRR